MKASGYRKKLILAALLFSFLFVGTTYAATVQSTDSRIEQAVRDALERNSALTGVDVKVLNRFVTLSGEVDHYQDELDAETAARSVPGVREVHSSISVTTPQINDGELQGNLEDRVHFARADMGMTFPDVQVSVQQGIVTLAGRVSNPVEHSVVLALAGTADGVKGVQDRLQIMETSADDEAVRTEVNKTIYGDSLVNAVSSYSPVQAIFRDGVVTLMGEIGTAQEEMDIVTRIRAIHGVTSVNDELLVRDRQLAVEQSALDKNQINCTQH